MISAYATFADQRSIGILPVFSEASLVPRIYRRDAYATFYRLEAYATFAGQRSAASTTLNHADTPIRRYADTAMTLSGSRLRHASSSRSSERET